MTGELDYSLPPALRRISSGLRWFGWVSLWIQVVLAVVASGILLVAPLASAGESSNPGTGAGISLAVVGIVAAYVSIYWAFRYTRLARRLRSRDVANRPKPKDVMQALRIGLYISMGGMLISLLAGQAIVGTLFVEALSQPQGFVNPNAANNQYVKALDILVIQANTNVLLAHFASIACTLWLFRTVNRG